MLFEAPALRAAVQFRRGTICLRCYARLARSSKPAPLHRTSIYTRRRLHGAIVPDKEVQKNMRVSTQSFIHEYFSANTDIDRGWIKNGILAAWTTAHHRHQTATRNEGQQATALSQVDSVHDTLEKENAVDGPENLRSSNEQHEDRSRSPATLAGNPLVNDIPAEPPYRRRRRPRDEAGRADPIIPPDASSRLTTTASQLPASASIRRNIATYLSLSKPRLSFLILLTTTSAYSLYPMPDIISATTDLAPTALSTSTLTLLFLTTGTFLSSASANTLNMLMEPKYDAMMSRTRNRPLVRKLISTNAASVFAMATGTAGLTLLSLGTNDTVAFLSALNIFLYAGVYTPLKRVSVVNTWAGALVGGIPPLMGWAAAAGQVATPGHDSWRDLLFAPEAAGGWLLAALLFAWQFPHFNAIAHSIRDEYKNAGYKMMSWTNPTRAARVALRYSVAMFPICFGLYWVGVVNEGFLVISTACNAWMTREAWRFWKQGGAGGSARGLFWASVWQLPLVLVGALVCKTGLWEGFFQDHVNEAETKLAELDGALEEPAGNANPSSKNEKHVIANVNLAMMGFKRPS